MTLLHAKKHEELLKQLNCEASNTRALVAQPLVRCELHKILACSWLRMIISVLSFTLILQHQWPCHSIVLTCPRYCQAVRDNGRISLEDKDYADHLWQALGLRTIFRQINVDGRHACGLNPNLRIYRSECCSYWCWIKLEWSLLILASLALPYWNAAYPHLLHAQSSAPCEITGTFLDRSLASIMMTPWCWTTIMKHSTLF